MAVNEDVSAYSNAAASNTPAGGDTVGPDLDNHLRDMKKNIRQVAENFITVSDENFKGRIKSTTSGTTHTISYYDGAADITLMDVDDSANTVTPYVDTVAMGAVGKDLAKQTTTASAQTALDLTVGTIGGQLLAETATASARSRLDLGTAALETMGVGIGNVIELVTGSATSAASLPAVYGDKLLGLQVGLPSPDFDNLSSPGTVTANTTTDVAHGLGAVPTLWTACLRCTTTDLGYSVGDEVKPWNEQGNNSSVSVSVDATNVSIIMDNSAILVSKSANNAAGITLSRWEFVVRAWA